jgi:DNA-binding transcriptional ArsR family regulator
MIQTATDPSAGTMSPRADEMAGRLNALAHPARLEILRHLSAAGCCCCKDVVETLDLAQSTVSQHLKILVAAGLVRYAPDRQRSRYEIDRRAVADLARSVTGFLEACCEAGGSCGGP